jgi:hypothetical protein
MLEKDLEIKSTNKQRRKLVDYFNERREEKFWEKWHFKYTMRFDEVHLISKKMWFIEWLVKNNKIDHEKVYDSENYYAVDVWDNTDELLMLLAISENPISDLISYLK